MDNINSNIGNKVYDGFYITNYMGDVQHAEYEDGDEANVDSMEVKKGI